MEQLKNRNLFISLHINMQSIKKVYLSTNNLQNTNSNIRIFTKFYRPIQIDRIKSEDLIAEINVLTASESYEGIVKRKNINKELAWNNDLLNRLQNAFSGKSNNLITNIQNGNYANKFLIFGIQLQMKMIRIILFEVELKVLGLSPLSMMRLLMNNLHQQRQQEIINMRLKQKREKQRLNQIDQILVQLKQNHKDEIGLYKQKFIPVINQAKKKLIKCFGNVSEDMQKFLLIQDQEELPKRQIFKLKKNNLNNSNKKLINEMKDQVQQLFGPQN